MKEKIPKGHQWTQHRMVPQHLVTNQTVGLSCWHAGPITVISELANMKLPKGEGEGLTWLISITRKGKRPKTHHVRRARRAFDMVEAELDCHHPGNARHFFLVVAEADRVECECKTDEDTIVEPDGYTWTNPNDGAPCRGCEFETMMGKPCPIHSGLSNFEFAHAEAETPS